MTRLSAWAAVILTPVFLPLLLVGCGNTDESAPRATPESSPETTRSPTPEPTASGTPADGTELMITVNDGAGTVTRWTLTCDPPGGDHPDAAAACQALQRNGATALPPVPKDQACTMIFGGPQTASITGTWQGTAILSTLSLANGCEIARWKALAGLLPPADS